MFSNQLGGYLHPCGDRIALWVNLEGGQKPRQERDWSDFAQSSRSRHEVVTRVSQLQPAARHAGRMKLDRREITEVRARNVLRSAGLAEPDAVEYSGGEITLVWYRRRVAIVIDGIPGGRVEVDGLEEPARLHERLGGDLEGLVGEPEVYHGPVRGAFASEGELEPAGHYAPDGSFVPDAGPRYGIGPDDDIPF